MVERKFFVTVIASSKHSLLRLHAYELDLFRATAKAMRAKEFAIDGLLTLEQVGRLVEDGYQVLVKEESSKKARARFEVAPFEEWIKRMSR